MKKILEYLNFESMMKIIVSEKMLQLLVYCGKFKKSKQAHNLNRRLFNIKLYQTL